ncbi:MAG: phosphoribosyl-ATP diphosphatase [Halobacteriales archaeon]
MTDTGIFKELYDVVEDRRDEPREDSYTSSLLEEGVDAPLEKLGEEATEVTLAAKNDDTDELVHESADLIYHLFVVLAARGVKIEEVVEELEERRG